jgi:hypothetical protein
MLGVFRLFDEYERPPAAAPAGGSRADEGNWWSFFEDRPARDNPVVTGPYASGRFVRPYYATPRRGRLVPPFHPTRELYDGLGVVPPDLPAGLEAKAERMQRLVAGLSARGMRVYTFGSSDGPERWLEQEPYCINNPRYDQYIGARLHDYYLHFPSIAGCVTDGPGFGYEITPGFRGGGQLCAPLCKCAHCQAKASALGADLDAMERATRRAQQALHGLTPAQVSLFLESQQGVFDGIDLLFEDAALVDLLRFKTASVEGSIARIYRAVKAASPGLQYGICPRLPCFATMQGCNFRRLAQVTDFIQPKHYLWMDGFDGFRGTLARYRQTLREWNPLLDDTLLEALILRLLGVSLPDGYHIDDFSRAAPQSFFQEVVHRESRKMLQRIGDAKRISPFVGLEHSGIWLTPEELRFTLRSIAEAGLTRFTYFILNSIDDDIWRVITEFTAPG